MCRMRRTRPYFFFSELLVCQSLFLAVMLGTFECQRRTDNSFLLLNVRYACRSSMTLPLQQNVRGSLFSVRNDLPLHSHGRSYPHAPGIFMPYMFFVTLAHLCLPLNLYCPFLPLITSSDAKNLSLLRNPAPSLLHRLRNRNFRRVPCAVKVQV